MRQGASAVVIRRSGHPSPRTIALAVRSAASRRRRLCTPGYGVEGITLRSNVIGVETAGPRWFRCPIGTAPYGARTDSVARQSLGPVRLCARQVNLRTRTSKWERPTRLYGDITAAFRPDVVAAQSGKDRRVNRFRAVRSLPGCRRLRSAYRRLGNKSSPGPCGLCKECSVCSS
jgi:hypothetical protein